MQQRRTIEVGDATLDCTLCGLGAPVVLLANAGCILIIWRTHWNEHALREQFGERVQAVDPPDVGHFLLLEQPEAVARAVSEFLSAGNAPG